MRDWPSRYKAGERQDVWVEMRGYGARLSHDQRLEAADVVRLTIMGVLANLVRIELELHRLGYEFVSLSAKRFVQLLRGQVGPVAEQTPASPEPAVEVRDTAFGTTPISSYHLNRYEKSVAPVPMLLAEFWRQIGWADFTGRESTMAPAMLDWRPMVVNSPVGLVEDFEAFLEDNGETGFEFELIPDSKHADGCRASQTIRVAMQFGADARLSTGEWFVDYLKRMTKHACLAADGDASTDFKRELDRIRADWSPF